MKKLFHLSEKTHFYVFFDLRNQTFIFVNGHKTGLSAILAQGDNIESAKPIDIKSRSTNKAESSYPQLDLEGMAVDFANRRFRQYLLGSPKTTISGSFQW